MSLFFYPFPNACQNCAFLRRILYPSVPGNAWSHTFVELHNNIRNRARMLVLLGWFPLGPGNAWKHTFVER